MNDTTQGIRQQGCVDMTQLTNAQNVRGFQDRIGRIQKGKTTRPNGVLVNEREVAMAMAQTRPPKSRKDVVLVPLALGLGILCVLMGSLFGPMIEDMVLSRWPDAEDLLKALPTSFTVPIIFGAFACILCNISTGKRQMAFVAGVAGAYLSNGAIALDLGTQAPMLAALL